MHVQVFNGGQSVEDPEASTRKRDFVRVCLACQKVTHLRRTLINSGALSGKPFP